MAPWSTLLSACVLTLLAAQAAPALADGGGSSNLVGIHDLPGSDHDNPVGALDALMGGNPGWVVVALSAQEMVDDNGAVTGWGQLVLDRIREADAAGYSVIVRMDHGDGVIPHDQTVMVGGQPEHLYDDYAQRVAAFAAAAGGTADHWIVGNEPNLSWSRPGGEGGDPITPEQYARAYTAVRAAVRATAGPGETVLVAPSGPWNTETTYPGNANGDWAQYFDDQLAHITALGDYDGVALHAYGTHTERRLVPGWGLHEELLALEDTMRIAATYDRAGAKQYHITEANRCGLGCDDGQEMWADADWITMFYDFVEAWNRGEVQGEGAWPQILSASLYRYDDVDRTFGLSRPAGDDARARFAREAAAGRTGADGVVGSGGSPAVAEPAATDCAPAPCTPEQPAVDDLRDLIDRQRPYRIPRPDLLEEWRAYLVATGAAGEETRAKWEEWFTAYLANGGT